MASIKLDDEQLNQLLAGVLHADPVNGPRIVMRRLLYDKAANYRQDIAAMRAMLAHLESKAQNLEQNLQDEAWPSETEVREFWAGQLQAIQGFRLPCQQSG